jgi:hypothetical protein
VMSMTTLTRRLDTLYYTLPPEMSTYVQVTIYFMRDQEPK